MKLYNKALSLFLLAAMAVYAGRTDHAGAATPKMGVATDVKVLEDLEATSEEPHDPFESASTDTTTRPASEGQSVSSSDVLVNDSGTVEIHVNDANLVEVLRMLSLQSQRNIVASNNVRGTVTANLYGVTVREALDAILHANGYAYQEKGNFIFVYTTKEIAEMERANRVTTTEVFKLYYTPAANAANMIKPVLSSEAQVSLTTPAVAGLESGTGDVGGGSHAIEDILVVTDYAENLDRVRKILKDVDRRPQQILIEATILRATLTEDNALGVDFTLMGGVDFSTLTGVGSSTTAALNGQIINQPGTGSVTGPGYAGAGTSFAQNVPSGGMRMGIVHNNIAVFLSALESITDTTILANPKVLALNKQKGEVIVGRKDGYLTTTVTQTSQTQTVEFLDTGTRLIFRPFIGDDGYIRMEIHPEDSSGGLTSSNLPFKVTTEVTSNVMVKDGHTIVIGGLFRESSDISRSQTPFLGNLPLAGYLFRSQRDRTTREEVIILLTPHIIKDDSAYSKLSEEQLRLGNQLRVGVRNGMMPFGRERLSDMYYQWATAELNKATPNRQKAIYYLNCATNLNPLFLEAIELKQSLTGKELKTVTNSSIDDFVRKQLLVHDLPPATQPIAGADLPATQPVAVDEPMTQPVAAAEPTTMPSEIDTATAATTQPAETIMTADATTQPSADAVAVTPTTQPADSTVAEAPVTQPTVVITELPAATQPSADGGLAQAVAESLDNLMSSDSAAAPVANAAAQALQGLTINVKLAQSCNCNHSNVAMPVVTGVEVETPDHTNHSTGKQD